LPRPLHSLARSWKMKEAVSVTVRTAKHSACHQNTKSQYQSAPRTFSASLATVATMSGGSGPGSAVRELLFCQRNRLNRLFNQVPLELLWRLVKASQGAVGKLGTANCTSQETTRFAAHVNKSQIKSQFTINSTIAGRIAGKAGSCACKKKCAREIIFKK